MSATIASNPPTFVPANQPLIFTFSTDTTITDAFRFVVQVLENGTEIGKYYLAPNINDVAHFDLGELVRHRVEVDEANHTGTSTIVGDTTNFLARATTGVAEYQVRVGEWNGTAETLNDDNTTLVLIGGAMQKSGGLHPDFSTYYATGATRKGWLTDYLVQGTFIEMSAGDEDEGKAAFIAKNTASQATGIAYSVTTNAGTLAYYVPINATYGGLAPSTTTLGGYLQYASILPGSINGLSALDSPGGSASTISLTGWKSYTIQLMDSLVPKSRPIRVTRNCPYKASTQIAWANSVGGWDYMTFEGKRLTTTSKDSKAYRAPLGNWSAATYNFNGWQAEIKYFHQQAEEVYQLSGVFNEAEMTAIRSLLLAPKAFIRLDSWLPCVTQDTSISVREMQHKIYQVSFAVKLAQNIVC